MVKIIWTKRSLNDLEDIADFIAKDSPKYAKITLEGLIREALRLEKNPLIGRVVPEVNQENFRELIYGNYRIIYNHDKGKVNILTVHHSARDLRKRGLLPLD
ncbi:MAG: type II toxin-antitoxin system RelE/ParE family toxin [Bacteroidales bacterium]|nr:type II toxin-antitoxin system RelE/ParE family toxin [Bacteroidales bacterium]